MISSLMLMHLSLYAGTALEYLNTLRINAGLPVFTVQTKLNSAAQNHSDYLQINNISGHYQDASLSGFTGVTPADRVQHTGYYYKYVLENVSFGSNATYKSSIDNLFSAIYHRFSFLSLKADEIGIGVSNNGTFHTYDMGNKILNNLCTQSSYTGTGSYALPCVDTLKRISILEYENAFNAIQSASAELILWPSSNSADILPVFYEESPDPLPDHSVTGYPVSVEFNTKKFTSPPTVSSFSIEDTDGGVLNTLTAMNSTNDPNGIFTDYQHALFPEDRLEWGSRYNAELIYSHNGGSFSKNWCFTTQTLHGIVDKFYRIHSNTNISLNVLSGQTYAFYIVPNHSNDTLGSVSYSYTSDTAEFSYLDSNTISVNISGIASRTMNLIFSNGQKINLTIATSDTAIEPLVSICDSTQIQNFVSRFYIEILNRVADESGLNNWSNQLASGSKTASDIAKGFINSSEFIGRDLGNSEYINVLYAAFFGRSPDSAGFNDWLSKLNGGTSSRDDVLNGFLHSNEFKNLADSYGIQAIPSLSPIEQFVTRFYEQCLSRSPDEMGLNDWSTQLTNGSKAGADIARGFIFSEEFTKRALNNSDFVRILYRTFFAREPDSDGFNTWVSQLNGGASIGDVLDGFLGAIEFSNLASTYGIRAN